MPDIWDTQAVLQTLAKETGAFHASQTCLIFLCSEANGPDVQLQSTQVALQALMPDTLMQASQTVLQLLMPDTGVQTSQAVLEALMPDAGFSHLKYIMRATDAAGAQYVYWETDDPSLAPLITQPFAVGALTDVRIFYEF